MRLRILLPQTSLPWGFDEFFKIFEIPVSHALYSWWTMGDSLTKDFTNIATQARQSTKMPQYIAPRSAQFQGPYECDLTLANLKLWASMQRRRRMVSLLSRILFHQMHEFDLTPRIVHSRKIGWASRLGRSYVSKRRKRSFNGSRNYQESRKASSRQEKITDRNYRGPLSLVLRTSHIQKILSLFARAQPSLSLDNSPILDRIKNPIDDV